jgi:hypothetical protein
LNKKNTAIFISRHNLKLNMGCDYYIDKSLYIYDYQDKTLSYINLEKTRGYYWYCKDEDEPDYDYDAYIKEILEPSMEPIIIYINKSFTKLSFEKKYEKLIDYELKICNKTWDDVNKIIKEEERYER